MKNALESIGNRADHIEESIRKLEDRKKMKKFYEGYPTLLGRATLG